MSVTMRREGNTGYVEMDNPPVNAIGQAMRQGLKDAVAWAEKEMLDRVILSGKGRAFAAGADAKEFDGPPLEPHLPEILNAIDESFVPWVAAIHGVALGGGAEVAMACRMRIMTPDARIGLPEVTLGVIPGAGGTQRLPRLVGLEKALEMISTGTPLKAEDALAAKLVHAVADDPIDAAFMVNTEELGCIVPTWELPPPELDSTVIEAARSAVSEKAPGQIAPPRAIKVIETGLAMPFHDALPIERAAFIELRHGDQARALRHIFFAERGAKEDDKGIGARLLARYYEAAETVFMDGATPWEVDEAMEGFGFATGPFEAQDLSGLDVAPRHAAEEGRRVIPLMSRMLELGKLGKTAGAGWYRYPGGGGKVDDPIVADLAIEESHFAGRDRTDYSAEDIRHRLVFALINEAADILHEGLAERSAEIDVISVRDLGFPRWRGGVMYFADILGAARIVDDLNALAKEDPVAWRVSPLLSACATEGTPLSEATPG